MEILPSEIVGFAAKHATLGYGLCFVAKDSGQWKLEIAHPVVAA
jgi:hypothetical protein